MKGSDCFRKSVMYKIIQLVSIGLLILTILSACTLNLTVKSPVSQAKTPSPISKQEEQKQIDPNAMISGSSESSIGMRESIELTSTASSMQESALDSGQQTKAANESDSLPGQIQQSFPTEVPKATPTPVQYKPFAGCAVSQLHVGDSAYVNFETGSVSMRTEPVGKLADATVVRKLGTGEIVHIIDGPKCDLGWVFWEVRTVNSEYGWLPEGDGTEFFIVPISTIDACSDAKPGRLKVGERAFVEPMPEDANRLYPEPKVDASKLIYRMPPGTYMEVLEGPVCGNNQEGVWWKVRADSGDIGWTRESDYSKAYYFIAPVIPRP